MNSIDQTQVFEMIGNSGTFFEPRDKNKLYYSRYGNGQEPILFLHTLRTQGEYHHKILPAFADDFDCFVIDWPGHGRSSRDQKVAYSADYMISQVVEFVEAMNLENITVVGESIGGTGALALAARIPERIKAVFASNPYDAGLVIGKPAGKMVSWLGQYVGAVTKDEVRPITKFLIGGGFYDRSKLEEKFLNLISTTAVTQDNFGLAFRSFLQNQKSWHAIRTNEYSKIPEELPVTLHYGDKDWSSHWVRKQNTQNVGGKLKVITSDKLGHFSFLENPDYIVGLIRENTLQAAA